LLGFDVLIDQKGKAYCLEVNGAPSISIEHEIPFEQDPNNTNKTKKDKEYILSPIDLYLKVNIMNSAIELATNKKIYYKFRCLNLILSNGYLKFESRSMFTGSLVYNSCIDSTDSIYNTNKICKQKKYLKNIENVNLQSIQMISDTEIKCDINAINSSNSITHNSLQSNINNNMKSIHDKSE